MAEDKILDKKIEAADMPTVQKSKFKLWLKRIGVAGFFFFLIKGLIWIAVFAGMGKCAFG